MSFREVRCLSKVAELLCGRPWFQKQNDATLEPTQDTLLPPCRCLLVFSVFNCTATSFLFICCFWVAQSYPTLCNAMDCSTLGFPVHHHSQSLLKLMSVESVMSSYHLFLCCPLLLLPSIFLSIKVFSNELALCINWPKYWSFSFSISPSNE